MIYNYYLRFDNNLSRKLLFKSIFAKVVEMDFQNKVIRVKIFYIEPISLLRTTSKVVRRLNLTRHSWVNFFRYNLAYFFIVKVPAKAMASQACNIVMFYRKEIFSFKKNV